MRPGRDQVQGFISSASKEQHVLDKYTFNDTEANQLQVFISVSRVCAIFFLFLLFIQLLNILVGGENYSTHMQIKKRKKLLSIIQVQFPAQVRSRALSTLGLSGFFAEYVIQWSPACIAMICSSTVGKFEKPMALVFMTYTKFNSLKVLCFPTLNSRAYSQRDGGSWSHVWVCFCFFPGIALLESYKYELHIFSNKT